MRLGEQAMLSYLRTSTCTITVLAALLVALLSVVNNSDLHASSASTVLSKLCWKNATVRPPLLLVGVVAGWGWVVSVCQSVRLEIDHVLGGPPQSPASTYHAALILLCILLGFHLAHFMASEIPGITWRPWLVSNLALNVAFAVLGMLPTSTVFFGSSRHSLLRVLGESVIAPFAPVTFWHVIVADYMTSLAKALADLQLTACISWRIYSHDAHGLPTGGQYVRTTQLWHQSYDTCADTAYNALFLALPFWWRLMQCLKVYSTTYEVKNLWNALKYSSAFPLVYAGYLRRHEPSLWHTQCFVMAAVVQSTFCFIWDVHMDWGLFRQANLGGKHLEESGRACCGGKPVICVLREPRLITSSVGAHVGLAVLDLCLRFIWALSVFGGIPGRGLGMLFFEAVEVGRRTVWAIFRIEWEVIVKVRRVQGIGALARSRSHVQLPLPILFYSPLRSLTHMRRWSMPMATTSYPSPPSAQTKTRHEAWLNAWSVTIHPAWSSSTASCNQIARLSCESRYCVRSSPYTFQWLAKAVDLECIRV